MYNVEVVLRLSSMAQTHQRKKITCIWPTRRRQHLYVVNCYNSRVVGGLNVFIGDLNVFLTRHIYLKHVFLILGLSSSGPVII